VSGKFLPQFKLHDFK